MCLPRFGFTLRLSLELWVALQCFSLYTALMRLAAVPSTAQRGFASQQLALEVLDQLAQAAGMQSADGLHEKHLPQLLHQVLSDATYSTWTAHSSDWHLVQALFRQCGGAVAASQLLHVVPVFAALLDPKKDPVLRGTALALANQLLDTEVSTVLGNGTRQPPPAGCHLHTTSSHHALSARSLSRHSCKHASWTNGWSTSSQHGLCPTWFGELERRRSMCGLQQ